MTCAWRMAAAGAILAAPLAAWGADAMTEPDREIQQLLAGLEKQSWVAWKARDALFFEGFLSDDHIEVGPFGFIDKATVVAGVGSPACKVESYFVGEIRFTRLAGDSAVLNYRAEQKTTCGGAAVPSPAWATSVYVKRGGKWLNVLYQQTPLPAPK